MRSRKLGAQGLEVSEQGLGCMGMSEFYGERDEREALATIHRALEAGVTLLDTADMYGPFTNEELVGRAVREQREAGATVLVATKFAIVRSDDGGFEGVRGDPGYVREACEASLRRLGVDSIDLYYQHRVDPDVPIEETVGAMGELVEAGKVAYLGLSEAAPETVRRAHAVHPISALQTEYSLWERSVEAEILPTVRELGIGLVPYSPLGRGLLTGRFSSADDFGGDDSRLERFPRFQGENLAENLRLVDRVKEIADEKGVKPGQLALAWVLAQGEDVVPIPGTKRRTYLEENVAASDVELTDEDRQRLEEAMPVGVAAGDRYADMSSVSR